MSSNTKNACLHLPLKIRSRNRKIEDYYEIGKEIGSGNFSKVYIACSRQIPSLQFAVKALYKHNLNENERKRIDTEMEVLKVCQHKNIVNLVDDFESPDYLYMVMELKSGGELFDRMISRGIYSENDAQVILKQLGDAISYLHSKGIVHRDLKPENMLFDTLNGDSVCLADFGLARFQNGNESMLTPCGTPGYVAPEIANYEDYKQGVDIWSLGVIMYSMLCGFPPFFSEDDDELMILITEAKYGFPSPYWDDVSDSAKDLIRNLLQKDPTQRYTAEQFMSHPWIKEGTFSKPIRDHKKPKLSNEKEMIKTVLNRSIDVRRDGLIMLKSVSESTLWKKRQDKFKSNKIPSKFELTKSHEEKQSVK